MAWSNSPATAPVSSVPLVSDAAIDAALNEAANALRADNAEAAAARLADLVPELVTSAERCDLAGLILLGAKKPAAAFPWFDRARRLQPTSWRAQSHAGTALLALGRLNEAANALLAAVAPGTADAVTFYHYGVVLRALGRKDEAIAALDEALRMEPDYPEALRVGGLILSEAGRHEQAFAFFTRALQVRPNFFEALIERANLLRLIEKHGEAYAAFTQALALYPGNPEFLNNRGVVLIDLGEPAAACADFDAALDARPDFPEAHFNRGTVLMRLEGPEAALAAFDRAIALRPVYPDALVGRGVALKELRRMDEALASFNQAIAQNPESAHAHNNKGALQLLQGDFENGLVGYEYRWIVGQTHKFKLEFPIPEWHGAIRAGEKLIVFDEQGIGDTIQFSRFLPPLAEAGLDITFFCRGSAFRLMQSLPQHIRCVNTFGPEERFDSEIALSSIPHALGTRLPTIPAPVPYLSAEKDLVATWAERLAKMGPMADFKIGLCWAGNPNVKADPERSIPLTAFLPLLTLPGVRVIAVQKHHGLEEIAGLPKHVRLETLGEDFDSGSDAFIDTAAVMQSLDLIVSCDTSVAHLAGALGRPTFVLLKNVPDWRWMLDRPDTPWYPTTRLFRQPKRGDWESTVAEVVEAVDAMRGAR